MLIQYLQKMALLACISTEDKNIRFNALRINAIISNKSQNFQLALHVYSAYVQWGE